MKFMKMSDRISIKYVTQYLESAQMVVITNAIKDLHSLVLEKFYLNLRNTCAKTMVCPRHIKCAELC